MTHDSARRLLVVAIALAALACSDDASTPASESSPPPAAAPTPAAPAAPEASSSAPTAQALAERGKAVYTANCIACHNPDPSQDGAIGPAIAGSSPELIEARVMRTEYPPGYTPKRTTHLMIALPFLESDLPALAAYLAR